MEKMSISDDRALMQMNTIGINLYLKMQKNTFFYFSGFFSEIGCDKLGKLIIVLFPFNDKKKGKSETKEFAKDVLTVEEK